MTADKYRQFVELLNNLNYREYRTDMWCKPVGFTLFCLDMETMSHYRLDKDIISSSIDIRSNISMDKLKNIIRQNEHKYK